VAFEVAVALGAHSEEPLKQIELDAFIQVREAVVDPPY